MHIDFIEQKIVERLKQNIENILIQSYPEKPQEFVFTHPVGAVLIHYQGGTYKPTTSFSSLLQTKRLDFSLTIITRNLKNNNGAYELLDRVRKLLTGFEVEGCTKLTPTKEGFLAETNGIWQYTINFETTTQCVEDVELPENPRITTLNFEEIEA